MSYIMEPEVAGGWGDDTLVDTSVHPPIVTALVYAFDGWSGDDLLTTFPCFIVTDRLAALIEATKLSGYSFAPVKCVKTETFDDLYPGRSLPAFRWLKVTGTVNCDDFAIDDEHRLVVSDAAYAVIAQGNIAHCEVIEC